MVRDATTRPDAAGNGDIDPIGLYNIQQQKRRQEARRRMLEDPRERELLKAQARSEARAANADLARELQLTDGEYDRLIERLAEYDLQLSELFSREERAPTGAQNDYQTLRDQLAQDIAGLLGYEKAQQYAAFEDSRQVRTQVRRLRAFAQMQDEMLMEQRLEARTMTLVDESN